MCDKYETICKDEFTQLHAKLDRLDESLRGNGKLGILTRLDRLEQARHWVGKAVWFLLGILGSVAVLFIKNRVIN